MDKWIYVVHDLWEGGATFYPEEADVAEYKKKVGVWNQYAVDRIRKVRGAIVTQSWHPNTHHVNGGWWTDFMGRMVKDD